MIHVSASPAQRTWTKIPLQGQPWSGARGRTARSSAPTPPRRGPPAGGAPPLPPGLSQPRPVSRNRAWRRAPHRPCQGRVVRNPIEMRENEAEAAARGPKDENTALEPRRPRRLVLGRVGPGLRGRHPQERPQLSGPRLRAHELAHEVPPGALRLLRRQFLLMEYAHCKTPSLYVPVLCSLVAHVNC